jgi:hypothetical protein
VVGDAALYVGTLRHRRFEPVSHEFTYQVHMPLLDVDALAGLMRVSRLTSCNNWNVLSYDDRDHLGDPGRPLRVRVMEDARRHGVDLPDGRILLLTNLRHFGYCFNPVSFYYVVREDGALTHVMAEVHNTFGGHETYWLQREAAGGAFRARAPKSLYVSPFMPVDLDYRFALTMPSSRLVVHMDVLRAGVRLFDATLSLERRSWSAAEIRRQVLRMPAMTMKVTAAIHWQALRLWAKGVPVVGRLTTDGVGERAAWQAEGSPEQ